MGYKSRSNYRIDLCLKEDCLNRGKSCNCCIDYSNYKPFCICNEPTHSAGTLPNEKDLIICNKCGKEMKK